MKNTTSWAGNALKIPMVLCLLAVCLSALPVSADNINAIKNRMKTRLPVVKALKAKKIIGENNKGYLEFIGTSRERQDIVNAENSDRRTIYLHIAHQSGTGIAVVEKHRAAQIRQNAAPGEWLQDVQGKWHRK